jgi:Tol biopolymer transport system component
MPPPVIFADLDENEVIGPGTYEESELIWSPDGQYLAYVDESGTWPRLGVYHIGNNKNLILSETHKIAWHPDGKISYMVYIPNDSVLTYPIRNNLHIIDPDGENERALTTGLGDVIDFFWFNNGEELLIVEREPDGSGIQNIYKVNSITGRKELFLGASELGVKSADTLALSEDESQLLIWTDNPCKMGRGDCVALVIYDMTAHQIIKRILGSQLNTLTVENGGVYGQNTEWINNDWIVTEGSAILDEAPFLSLAFVNTKEVSQSFEIEALNQFGGPVLSPDLARIAYINVNRGPDTEYITLSSLPQHIIDRLVEQLP